MRARRSSRGIRPCGTWARKAARTSARPGRAARSATPTADSELSSGNRADRSDAVRAELAEAGGACRAGPAASSGRRGSPPAASLAATIEPAEVPTKCGLCRKSIPPCCPAPARKPDSQASPSVPPAPRTSTSGGFTRPRCLLSPWLLATGYWLLATGYWREPVTLARTSSSLRIFPSVFFGSSDQNSKIRGIL